MKDPREITPVSEGETYIVPVYTIDNDGIRDITTRLIAFVKGDKSNSLMHRQDGFMTETLIAVCVEYLQDVQKGHLVDEDTQQAIYHLNKSLESLAVRQEKRKARGVNQTYQK